MKYYPTPVKIPDDPNTIVRNKKKNGATYIVYKFDVEYNPETKTNDSSRVGIGKMCEDDETMMYPNENFQKYFPEIPIPCIVKPKTDPEMHIGSFLVLQKIIIDYGLPDILKPILGERTGFFLDLSMYMVIKFSNVMQFYTDYARCHPLMTAGRKMYSDSTVSDYFKDLASGQSVKFQRAWNEKRDKSQRIYMAYDSTGKRCRAGDIDIAEFGGNPKQGEGPIFNLSIGYDHTNEVPLFYEDYSETVIDKKKISYMKEKAEAYGYKNIGFIFDRGTLGKEDIRNLDESNIAYVIMVKGMKDWIRGLIDDNYKTFELEGVGRIREKALNGITVHTEIHNFNVGEKCCHIFYSFELADAEKKKIDREISEIKKTLDDARFKGKTDVEWNKCERFFELTFIDDDGVEKFVSYFEKADEINKAYKYCGYFVIITSEDMTARDAYFLYRSRDEVEKLFRADKAFAPCERVDGKERLEGKQLVEFVALILYDYMREHLGLAYTEELIPPNYFSVTGAIAELEKIFMTIKPDGTYRLDSALSKEQKQILNVFGLDEQYVKKQAQRIGEIYAGRKIETLLTLSPQRR